MTQGIVVYLFPVSLHKGRYEQQERALRLMEVGDYGNDDLVVVSRSDDDLCAGVQGFQMVAFQVVEQGLQGLCGGDSGTLFGSLVGLPLPYVQLFFRGMGISEQGDANVV